MKIHAPRRRISVSTRSAKLNKANSAHRQVTEIKRDRRVLFEACGAIYEKRGPTGACIRAVTQLDYNKQVNHPNGMRREMRQRT